MAGSQPRSSNYLARVCKLLNGQHRIFPIIPENLRVLVYFRGRVKVRDKIGVRSIFPTFKKKFVY